MAAILLAEDSPTHTTLIRRLLEDAGHEVVCTPDGQQAMLQLEESCFDLVVTDLRMPNVNGVELVTQIAEHFPSLPSVVVTARGSESLAVDALAKGAANFVPKDSLAKLLARTVRQTIQLARVDSCITPVEHKEFPYEFTVSLKSDPHKMEPVVWAIVQTLAVCGQLDPTHRIRVGVAVMSGIFNAICYGNLELGDDDERVQRVLMDDSSTYKDSAAGEKESSASELEVTVRVSIETHDTRIAIRHTGRGRAARLSPAPGTPESFEVEQCRRLMLMTSFMDEVMFRHDASEVVMVKRHS